jgi:hypothetical protein
MAITQVVRANGHHPGGERENDGPEAAAAAVGHSHLVALIPASSMLARATTRMILAAQSVYASGRTSIAFAGQTIKITLGLPVGW